MKLVGIGMQAPFGATHKWALHKQKKHQHKQQQSTMTRNKNEYHGVFANLKSYLDDTRYKKEEVVECVSEQRCLQITPDDILHWMNF